MIKILVAIRYFTLLLFLSTLFPILLFAQEANTIKLISYRTENSILLRWAPASASDWLLFNKTGYTLERYTIIRDSIRVYPPEVVVLTNKLVPEELVKWEPVARDNDYAAIMAQAIYGNSFEPRLNKSGNGVIEAIQLSKGQELRYSYSLLAADQSFEVARMASLGYEDLEVNSNEAYMYKLYVTSGTLASDTAYAIVNKYLETPLPTITDIEADFRDRKVELRWNVDYLREAYSSYEIEKSTNGVDYNSINKLATITTAKNHIESGKWMIKFDSLKENNETVFYRIHGVTPFGDKGPYSETIIGKGTPTMSLSIGIRDASIIDGNIQINWEVDDDRGLIRKFEIERSIDAIKFELIDSVSGNLRSFHDDNALESNYYKIIALGAQGQRIESLPYFVQLEDSIPPKIPIGLNGSCDSLGVIALKWNKVEDSDLAGYRLFRSRVRDAEYIQITKEAVNDTVFIDSIDLSMLSTEVYYKILAVDHRGNKSNKSKYQMVTLADIIPPVPPRIIGFEYRSDSVEIRWINSSSRDVATLRIYAEDSYGIVLLKEILVTDSVSKFIDAKYYKDNHTYFLTAIDFAGNVSEISNKIKLGKSPARLESMIHLVAKVDRSKNLINLSWDLGVKGVSYKLYKSKGDEPISLYKVFEGGSSINDQQLEVNSIYKYLLQVVDEDLGTSFFSNQIKIKY